VIHDELEKPFGSVTLKLDGSHKGHNGLRSIMNACGTNFWRIRVGIGRPLHKEDVPVYVLQPFDQTVDLIDLLIQNVISEIKKLI